MNSWTICNEILHHNEKRELMLNTGIDGYELPATLVCGAAAGKTVLVTAGIHAGEYPGVAAVMRFAKALCPDQVSGNVIFLSNVNTSGFWAKTRGYFPVDDFNLNKDYPGAPDGSAGQRLADFFVTKIFPHVDFIIDLHSGGQNEPLEPCLFFPAVAGEAVRKASEAAARATTLPHLIASTARTGEYSYAAQMGIPGLLLERGSCGLCKPEWVDAYEQDLSRLFHHLGLLESTSVSAPIRQTVYERTV